MRVAASQRRRPVDLLGHTLRGVLEPLTFASYLGPNTTDAAEAITDHLARSLGRPVHHITAPPDPSADITWACGLVTTEGIARGRWDADIVAAPVFPGESRPVYRSLVIQRIGAVARRLYAINQVDSWSGHHALRVHLGHEFPTIKTGTHVGSVQAVRGGAADAAAIDSSVWAYLVAREPELERDLVVVDQTIDWPAPPFAVSLGLDDDLRAAILETLTSASVPGLVAIVPATTADYDSMRFAIAALPT